MRSDQSTRTAFISVARSVLLLASSLAALTAISSAPLAEASAPVGDFDGDGYSDSAIGVSFEADGAVDSAGALHVLYGGPGGLGIGGNQLFAESSAGMAGPGPGVDDRFGSEIVSGDFN